MSHPRCAKPRELTDLHGVAGDLFELFRETFGVPGLYELRLHDVDEHQIPANDPERAIAALAMHEVQSLRRAATPGQPVTNVDVVNVAAALHGAIEHLVRHPAGYGVEGALCEARDQINRAARVAAALGNGTDEGIVELR